MVTDVFCLWPYTWFHRTGPFLCVMRSESFCLCHALDMHFVAAFKHVLEATTLRNYWKVTCPSLQNTGVEQKRNSDLKRLGSPAYLMLVEAVRRCLRTKVESKHISQTRALWNTNIQNVKADTGRGSSKRKWSRRVNPNFRVRNLEEWERGALPRGNM